MNPAAHIISLFGGYAEVARIVGVTRAHPWKWTQPRKERGTGGSVPAKHIPALLAAAKERGIPLTLGDFFPDVEAAE